MEKFYTTAPRSDQNDIFIQVHSSQLRGRGRGKRMGWESSGGEMMDRGDRDRGGVRRDASNSLPPECIDSESR
jgi:hypothetical protein